MQHAKAVREHLAVRGVFPQMPNRLGPLPVDRVVGAMNVTRFEGGRRPHATRVHGENGVGEAAQHDQCGRGPFGDGVPAGGFETREAIQDKRRHEQERHRERQEVPWVVADGGSGEPGHGDHHEEQVRQGEDHRGQRRAGGRDPRRQPIARGTDGYRSGDRGECGERQPKRKGHQAGRVFGNHHSRHHRGDVLQRVEGGPAAVGRMPWPFPNAERQPVVYEDRRKRRRGHGAIRADVS